MLFYLIQNWSKELYGMEAFTNFLSAQDQQTFQQTIELLKLKLLSSYAFNVLKLLKIHEK